jgi:hypothetical protein
MSNELIAPVLIQLLVRLYFVTPGPATGCAARGAGNAQRCIRPTLGSQEQAVGH